MPGFFVHHVDVKKYKGLAMKAMRFSYWAAVAWVVLVTAGAGAVSSEDIDAAVLAGVEARGLQPAPLCTDEVFIRRIYLDVIGTLPTVQEAARFLKDARPDKRSRCINALLAREEFTDYWALKWGDLLRVKAEFPINLWPNAVQAYQHWIRDALYGICPGAADLERQQFPGGAREFLPGAPGSGTFLHRGGRGADLHGHAPGKLAGGRTGPHGGLFLAHRLQRHG
jgi:hypothetical protein